MLTGEIRSQIDSIWNDFWSGGVSNPLSVIEQITYLLFIKRLDELHTVEERKATQLKIEMERRIFPKGKDERGRAYDDLRWSRFKSFEPREMFTVVDEHVFPFLRTLGGEGSAFSQHMKDARLGIPTPALLTKAVEKLDAVRMEDRDTKGDVYEYMLGKIATAGQNGQFRTPRHIIALMVELTEPTPTDIICDPAVGTCGFLVAAGEYLRRRHPEVLRDPKLRRHFHETVKTKKTELLFLALFLRLLKVGGRAAVIVPDGVLFGSSKAHKDLRRMLVEDHKLDAVIKLPSGAFRPYAGVSTAILVFTKTGVGGTDHVWFYDIGADGWSLDDKRQPLLPEEKLGPTPQVELTDEDHSKNNLPDVLMHWEERDDSERNQSRTEQSFCVPKAEIAVNGYDLSLNRYREVEHAAKSHDSPATIIDELNKLETEIVEGIKQLKDLVA
jgi:type I restriction-modification system DNA methylase subunit